MTTYGLVGTGHWADVVHASALTARDDGDLLVWGRTPEKARALAERHGARAVGSADELFAAADVVAFAVPPDVQAPLAVRAAEAGCHLLLEKPLALDMAAADEVVAAVESAGVRSAVYFTARFDPTMTGWLDHARAQGPWTGGRAVWFGANAEPDSPYRDSAWRKTSGGLWDVAPHSLSLLLPLLGPVEDVVAIAGLRDLVHVAMRHADGGSSTLSVSITMPPAAARIDAVVYGPDGWSAMPEWQPDAVAGVGRAVDELLTCAVDGTDHPCDAAFARDVVAILARAEATLHP